MGLIVHKETLAKNHFELPLGKIVVVSHGQARPTNAYPTPGCVSDSILFFFFSLLFFSFPPFSFLESRGSFRSGRGRRADITRYWTGFAYACEIASVSRYTVSPSQSSSSPRRCLPRPDTVRRQRLVIPPLLSPLPPRRWSMQH